MTVKSSQLVANIFKALSHPARLQIIKLLKGGSQCVCEILPQIDLEQSNASQHLAVLRNQGIVSSRKEGTMVFYEIKSPEILQMISLAEQMIVRQLEETKSLVEESF
jgi:DNA-binding transcriptional ArsR family regulator